MSIISDYYEEKYGDLIKAADDYAQSIKAEDQKIIDSLNFKLNNLQEMLWNVCRHTYMLKANQITVDQLFAIVNGCLNEEMIDRFTWDYLMDEESKKSQTHKKIQDVMKKYIHDYDDVKIKTDEIDESGSPVIIASKRDIYEDNLTQQDIEDAFKEEK